MLDKDFYKLMKIYEDYTYSGDQTNYPVGVQYDSKNSYRAPAANGPGNEPVRNVGGNPSSGDIIDYPDGAPTRSASEVIEMFLTWTKELMDEASKSGDESTLAAIKDVYSRVLELKMPPVEAVNNK